MRPVSLMGPCIREHAWSPKKILKSRPMKSEPKKINIKMKQKYV